MAVLFSGVLILAGGSVIFIALLSAIKTFVLPRSAQDGLVRVVFLVVRRVFNLWLGRRGDYLQRDRLLAYFAPVGLVLLLPTWLGLVLIGYTLLFRAVGGLDWYQAFRVSGSSLLTLGSFTVEGVLANALEFSEATIGLLLVALLISYLPTIYAAFQRRETMVTRLEVRAGNPPSAVEMITRFYRIQGLSALSEMWRSWEVWFSDIEESHTTLPVLVFYRSPSPRHSWVTAAGAVLDAASLVRSSVDVPHDPQADLCIRAGYLALRKISDFFEIEYNPNPRPDDPISVTQQEYHAALDALERAGVPLLADREQAWRDFSGWRVNYDKVLLALARLTDAPKAPWSGDRAKSYHIPEMFRLARPRR